MFIFQHREQLKMCKTLDRTSSQNRDLSEKKTTEKTIILQMETISGVNLDVENFVRRFFLRRIGAPI